MSCTASSFVTRMIVAVCVLWSCAVSKDVAPPAPPESPHGIRAYTAMPATRGERTCAWFADQREGVMYVGLAGFWSAYRRTGGDPTADLAVTAPKRIGRFDLARERWLTPLSIESASASGTWDVLAHPNGRLYFSDLFGTAGFVDPERRTTQRLPDVGPGLNELVAGPDATVLATRYGGAHGGPGSVVVLDPDGVILAEHPLAPEPGFRVAAKSLGFDPIRRVVWVNTDLLPEPARPTAPIDAPHAAADGIRYDTRILDLATGREQARFETPELHFLHFEPDGRGYFAWLDGARLVLRRTAPGAATGPDAGAVSVLDEAFPAGLDFVQELRPTPDGSVLAMRWSGRLHEVAPNGTVRTRALPRLDADGLYYSAFAVGDRVCASYCADLTIVCAPRP
ncbi:MAG: hypothetical protein M5U32_01460 [Myxococcota bacterium]|nr:hypothetical protein [Myxococcota bacterium]